MYKSKCGCILEDNKQLVQHWSLSHIHWWQQLNDKPPDLITCKHKTAKGKPPKRACQTFAALRTVPSSLTMTTTNKPHGLTTSMCCCTSTCLLSLNAPFSSLSLRHFSLAGPGKKSTHFSTASFSSIPYQMVNTPRPWGCHTVCPSQTPLQARLHALVYPCQLIFQLSPAQVSKT